VKGSALQPSGTELKRPLLWNRNGAKMASGVLFGSELSSSWFGVGVLVEYERGVLCLTRWNGLPVDASEEGEEDEHMGECLHVEV